MKVSPFLHIMPLVAAAGLTLPFSGASAQPHSLSGYCLDMREGGCMPRFLPFHGLSIDFCEESCTMTNPVSVRDLDAVLYDMECIADYDTPLSGRVMVLSQTSWSGHQRLSFIDERETLEIVPCP